MSKAIRMRVADVRGADGSPVPYDPDDGEPVLVEPSLPGFEGGYLIVDGRHRVTKARALGRRTIKAKVGWFPFASTRNARRAAKARANRNKSSRAKQRNLRRQDPTLTGGLRRALAADLRKRFAILAGRIVRLVGQENAFGLAVNREGAVSSSLRQGSATAGSLLVHRDPLGDYVEDSWEFQYPVVNAKDALGHGSDERHAGRLAGIADFARGAPGKLLGKVKDVAAKRYGQLSERYGPTWAKAVVGAAIAGLAIPAPGSSFLVAAPVLALAEMHRMMSPARNEMTANRDPLEDAHKLLGKLNKDFGLDKVLRVDLDGTILKPADYPEFGEPRKKARKVLAKKKAEGWTIVVWTARLNPIDEIEAHLRKCGIPFDAAEKKPHADAFVDDKAVGGGEKWKDIYDEIDDKMAVNARFAFHSTSEQLSAFGTWLNQQFADLFLSQQVDAMLHRYAEAGMRKGFGRSFDDTKRLRREAYERGDKAEVPEAERLSFDRGTKEEFLRSSFQRPVIKEKVKVLASRTFSDIKNVTHDAAAKMHRVLSDGLVQGRHPKNLAKDLVGELDLPKGRAETIARTEIIRAHAEGQLDALENLGVAEVGVEVEWATARDDAVCPECEDMEGEVFEVEEAHGMIPAHPNCRCAFVPALPDWARGK